jgi:hypothetical protein
MYMRDKVMQTKKIKGNRNKKIKLGLYAKYVGNNRIKTAVLDTFCDEIQRKCGYDVACRLLSAALEYLSKEELKNFGYKLVSLNEVTTREFKQFPGIFADNYNIDGSEKGVYKCLYDYPIFDHPYAVYKNRKLLCICIEPYNVPGKDITNFISTCEKSGNHVFLSGRGTHFPGRSFVIKIFPTIMPEIKIVSIP